MEKKYLNENMKKGENIENTILDPKIQKMIYEKIGGYEFSEPKLLVQAFTRKSYSEENGGENNEVLEFYGDRALYFAVSVILYKKFGRRKIKNKFGWYTTDDSEIVSDLSYDRNNYEAYDEYMSTKNEAELSKYMQILTQKKTLANQMDYLNLAMYLRMGKGDIKNNIQYEDSVKEDLFEAILGAIAIDANWDPNVISECVKIMLEPNNYIESNEDNYTKAIEEWISTKTSISFRYMFMTASLYWPLEFNGIKSSNYTIHSKHACRIALNDELPEFLGYGVTKSEAREDACKLAYNYLKKHNLLLSIEDEIDDPNIENAISQLETLSRRGYFKLPTYNFKNNHDANGNPIWYCTCTIEDQSFKSNKGYSKKSEAKKDAAYTMLLYKLKNTFKGVDNNE